MVTRGESDIVRRTARTVKWRPVTDREGKVFRESKRPLARVPAKKQARRSKSEEEEKESVSWRRTGLSFVPQMARMPSLGLAASRWWPEVGRGQSAARETPPQGLPPDWEKTEDEFQPAIHHDRIVFLPITALHIP